MGDSRLRGARGGRGGLGFVFLIGLLAGWGCDEGEAGSAVDAARRADGGDGAPPEPDGEPSPHEDAGAEPDAAPKDQGPDAAAMDRGPMPDRAVDAAAPECPVCPGAQRCEPATGQCVEPAICADDGDCFEGRHCLAGACVDDCREDADCPAARICDGSLGRCAEPPQCFGDADCDPGRLCVAGGCAAACGDEAPCPGAQVCQPDGRCQDAAVCQADADCAGARVCSAGSCQAACVDDADCPGTRRCDGVTGRCPEREPCFVPEDCDPGRHCVAGICEAGCRGDGDCAGGLRCDGGMCVEPVPCGADGDCRGARICEAGACLEPCRENADCPGAATCDGATGRCSGLPPECRRDRDCAEGQRCAQGVCRDLECEENADCPAACVDQLCAEGPPVGCLADRDCGALRCAPVGICARPGPCGGDGDCPAAGPLCREGRCVACQADADCAPSEFCQADRCVLFGGCVADGDCPGSRVCVGLRCEPGGRCAGDVHDFPGRPPTLALRTHTGLIACDGDEDVYRVEIPAGAGLRVTARAEAPPGDLALRVTGAGQEATLARADGFHPIEITGLFDSPAPRSVDVHVRARPGWDVPYSLSLEAIGPAECLPDEMEGPFGNDQRELADPVGPEGWRGRLCPGDTDWLRFEAPPGVALRVVATPGALPEAMTLRLEGPEGALLVTGEVEERALVAAATTRTAGTHALRLRPVEGAAATTVDVQISATATPEAGAGACAAARPLALGEARWLRRGFEVDGLEAGCAPGLGSADRVYRLELPAPRTVVVTVDPDDRQTALSLRSDCLDAASESHCAFDARLGPVALPAGVHFLLVESGGFTPQRLLVEAAD